jgi:uncharacterized protein (TIRG00374 family)
LGAGVSPTAVGGGYIKVAVLVKKGMSPGTATSLMMLGSMEDLLFFALSIPLAMLLTSPLEFQIFNEFIARVQAQKNFMFFVIIGLISWISFYWIFKKTKMYAIIRNIPIFSRICSRLKQFWMEFVSVFAIIGKKGKSRLVFTLGLTAVQWICRFSVISALLASLNISVHPIKLYISQWIIYIVGTFIPTPGGSVGVEATFYYIYKNIIPSSTIGIVTAGWRFLTYYLQLIVGVALFILMQFKMTSWTTKVRRYFYSPIKGNP